MRAAGEEVLTRRLAGSAWVLPGYVAAVGAIYLLAAVAPGEPRPDLTAAGAMSAAYAAVLAALVARSRLVLTPDAIEVRMYGPSRRARLDDRTALLVRPAMLGDALIVLDHHGRRATVWTGYWRGDRSLLNALGRAAVEAGAMRSPGAARLLRVEPHGAVEDLERPSALEPLLALAWTLSPVLPLLLGMWLFAP